MSLPPHADIPEQLAIASGEWIRLRRMSAYAAFDGWCLAILGGLTLICGGFGSVMGLFISGVLIGTGLFEIRGVRRLRRLVPGTVSYLAYNQLVLAGGLILYAIVSLIQSRNGGVPPELADALAVGGGGDDTKNTFAAALAILYSSLIAFALLVQGGTALYYFSRQKYFDHYLQQSPAWIQQMQRERGEVSL